MRRPKRILNFTCTNATTWYKAFDEADYQKNTIKGIKFKLRETSTEDHFRYAFESSPSTWMTSTSGVVHVEDIRQLWVYMPNNAGEVLEIELIYK